MSARFAALIARHPTMKLASKLKISPKAVSHWKSALALPQACNYERIADACGLSVDEIAKAVTQDHIERLQARRAAKHKPLAI